MSEKRLHSIFCRHRRLCVDCKKAGNGGGKGTGWYKDVRCGPKLFAFICKAFVTATRENRIVRLAKRTECPVAVRKSQTKQKLWIGRIWISLHKYLLYDFIGSSICEHSRYKRSCKDCKGSGICVHNLDKRCVFQTLLRASFPTHSRIVSYVHVCRYCKDEECKKKPTGTKRQAVPKPMAPRKKGKAAAVPMPLASVSLIDTSTSVAEVALFPTATVATAIGRRSPRHHVATGEVPV